MCTRKRFNHADPDALQCKVIALLEMDKYTETITEFDSAQFNMEKAYCLQFVYDWMRGRR